MRILRLHLRDFRRHGDLEVVPAAGLTAIVGPNESGKSSIAEALEMVLFRKAESVAQATLEVARWGAEAPPAVTLEFEADGQSGRLTKVFGGPRGSVELVLGEETVRDPSEVQRRIEALTGLAGERLYRSTASVRHHELAALEDEGGQLSDRLQVVVSGADRGSGQARRMLEEAIRRYRTEGPRNPGLLKTESDRVAGLEAQLAQGEAALARLEADRGAWVLAQGRRVEQEATAARITAELRELERAAELVDRRDAAAARYERLRRACELDEERRTILVTPAPPLPVAELRSHVARVEALEYEVSELEASLDVDHESAAPAPLPAPPKPWPFIVAALLLTVGAVVAWLALDRTIGLIAVLALAVIAVISLSWSVRVAREARRVDMDVRFARVAQASQRMGAEERQDTFRRKRRELDNHLVAIGAATPGEATATLATAEKRAEDLARVDGELRGLLGDERPDDLVGERDRAAGEAERASHALADMGGPGEDQVAELRRLRAALAATTAARDTARSEEDQALGRADSNPADAEAVALLAERLDESRSRLAEMAHRVRVYEGTLEAIVRAEAATMKTAARFLEERMAPDLERITGGRYESVRVDERDLSFRVWSAERGDEVPVSALSRGTADQLYLVARLGLVRVLTTDRRPPIVLDDPFVTFDDDRARRALEVVKRVCADLGTQVFHLTVSERHLEVADAVVRLPAPAVVPAGPRAPRRAPRKAPPVPVEVGTMIVRGGRSGSAASGSRPSEVWPSTEPAPRGAAGRPAGQAVGPAADPAPEQPSSEASAVRAGDGWSPEEPASRASDEWPWAPAPARDLEASALDGTEAADAGAPAEPPERPFRPARRPAEEPAWPRESLLRPDGSVASEASSSAGGRVLRGDEPSWPAETLAAVPGSAPEERASDPWRDLPRADKGAPRGDEAESGEDPD